MKKTSLKKQNPNNVRLKKEMMKIVLKIKFGIAFLLYKDPSSNDYHDIVCMIIYVSIYIYDLICTYNFSLANEVLELLPRTIAVMEKTYRVRGEGCHYDSLCKWWYWHIVETVVPSQNSISIYNIWYHIMPSWLHHTHSHRQQKSWKNFIPWRSETFFFHRPSHMLQPWRPIKRGTISKSECCSWKRSQRKHKCP